MCRSSLSGNFSDKLNDIAAIIINIIELVNYKVGYASLTHILVLNTL